MKNKNLFYNKVIKQGNSLCVRIPYNISKKFSLSKEDVVAVELINMSQETKILPSELIKVYKNILKEFSSQEIKEFLNYLSIEKTTGEKLKINERYNKFKNSVKENKTKIKENLKQTNFWKKLNQKNNGAPHPKGWGL